MGRTASSRPELPGPLHVWDVDRLRALTADLPVRDVALSQFSELDRVVWYGRPEHVGRLTLAEIGHHLQQVSAADLSQPIILSSEGHVLDGFHRLLKAHLAGWDSVPAVQFDRNPPPDETRPAVEWPYSSRR